MRDGNALALVPPAEPGWTTAQRRLLAVLTQEGHRHQTVREICRLAGYHQTKTWYAALRDERFAAAVRVLGVCLSCQESLVEPCVRQVQAALQRAEPCES